PTQSPSVISDPPPHAPAPPAPTSSPTRRSSDLALQPPAQRHPPSASLISPPLSAPPRPMLTPAPAVIINPELAAAAMSWPMSSRSEEHTSELQSCGHLVCRLLLGKKK